MLHGIEARDLSLKDRITLQARIQVMTINGKPVEEIQAYAARFISEYRINVPEGIGPAFSEYMARAGFLCAVVMVLHAWGI